MTRSKIVNYNFNLFIGTTILFFIDFIVSIFKSNIYASMDVTSWIFYVLSAISQAFIFSIIILLIPFVLSLIFRSRYLLFTLYIIFTLFAQTALTLDIFIYDIYKFHINGFILEMVLGDSASDIFVIDSSVYLWMSAILILCTVLPTAIIVAFSRKNTLSTQKKKFKALLILFLVSTISCHLIYAFGYAFNKFGIQKSATAIPYYYPLRANTLFLKFGVITDDNDLSSLDTTNNFVKYPKSPIKTTGTPNLNVILILLDSWNPRTFTPEVMPNLSEFSKKTNLFSNHLSSSNGTQGSMFGIFFGLPHTYGNDFKMSGITPVLIDQFVDNNYAVDVHTSATITNPPFHKIIFGKVDSIKLHTEGVNPFEKDNQITADFLHFLNTRDTVQPFFSFLFYDLDHAISLPDEAVKPFTPAWDHPDYLALNNSMDPTLFFNLYKNCSYNIDLNLDKVFKALEQKNLLENTVIIVTGDHGQEFNENKKNYWGHSANYSQYQIKVPMMIYYPNIENPGKVYDHTTTHYDFVPTISKRFLGVENPYPDYSIGTDIYDSNSRYPHMVGEIVNYGFVTDDYIFKFEGHLGTFTVTDKSLNPKPNSILKPDDLKILMKKKNSFYKE